MPHSDSIVTALRQRGFRITNVRRAVISVLTSSEQPLGALEILAALQARSLNVNKTTVYRELDFLCAQAIVNEIDLLDGMKRYEMIHEDHHHHHLVCTKCKRIQCVEMANDLDEIEKRIKSTYSFAVESHVLEFFGVCSDCIAA